MAIELQELIPPQAPITLIRSFTPFTAEVGGEPVEIQTFLAVGGYGIFPVTITVNGSEPDFATPLSITRGLESMPLQVGRSTEGNAVIVIGEDGRQATVTMADLDAFRESPQDVINYVALTNMGFVTLGYLLQIINGDQTITIHTIPDGENLLGADSEAVGPSSRCDLLLPYQQEPAQETRPQFNLYDNLSASIETQ